MQSENKLKRRLIIIKSFGDFQSFENEFGILETGRVSTTHILKGIVLGPDVEDKGLLSDEIHARYTNILRKLLYMAQWTRLKT